VLARARDGEIEECLALPLVEDTVEFCQNGGSVFRTLAWA
jgi:hypothetical protein